MTSKLLALLSLAPAVFSVSASAATIVWGDAVTISADSDVSTTGTSVFAANFDRNSATTSITVNGVTFVGGSSGLTDSTIYGNSLTYDVTSSATSAYGSSSAPFSGLSVDYQSLLQAGIFDTGAGPHAETLTLGNLSIGQMYQVQFWIHDARSNSNAGGTMEIVGTSTVLDYNTGTSGAGGVNPYAGGGLGQYAIGTFTADATTQSFNLNAPDGQWHLNALQLRAVPEPSRSILALAGVTALALIRRRPRRQLL